MQLQLSHLKKKSLEISDAVFGCEFNEALIHQVVTAYLSGGRAGTKAQKTRSQVSGGGAKPWNQKGGGRARAGTIRSPIWRKGGKVFAAVPRDHSQKVNKKMYRGAIKSILSEMIRLERMVIVDTITIEKPKTSALIKYLTDLKLEQNLLIITDDVNENLYLSARNLPHVYVCDAQAANPVALVGAEKVLITSGALKQFEEMLS